MSTSKKRKAEADADAQAQAAEEQQLARDFQKALKKKEDEDEFKRKKLLEMIVIGTPDMVDIFIEEGEDRQTFRIHKDLLGLYSKFLYNELREYNPDKKLGFSCNPSIFAEFQTWLYNGELKLHVPPITCYERWALGSRLRAPGFQNLAMNQIRRTCATLGSRMWITVAVVGAAYKITRKGSILRKFIADLIDCEKPIQKLPEGSPQRREWDDLLSSCNELSFDIANAGIQWRGIHPWDDIHRNRYMEPEILLDEVMERQILAKRTQEEVEEAAKTNCVRSKKEMLHLRKLRNARRVIDVDAQEHAQ